VKSISDRGFNVEPFDWAGLPASFTRPVSRLSTFHTPPGYLGKSEQLGSFKEQLLQAKPLILVQSRGDSRNRVSNDFSQ
jgi:hypothetical protein